MTTIERDEGVLRALVWVRPRTESTSPRVDLEPGVPLSVQTSRGTTWVRTGDTSLWSTNNEINQVQLSYWWKFNPRVRTRSVDTRSYPVPVYLLLYRRVHHSQPYPVKDSFPHLAEVEKSDKIVFMVSDPLNICSPYITSGNSSDPSGSTPTVVLTFPGHGVSPTEDTQE